jgi:hypothetical protein
VAPRGHSGSRHSPSLGNCHQRSSLLEPLACSHARGGSHDLRRRGEQAVTVLSGTQSGGAELTTRFLPRPAGSGRLGGGVLLTGALDRCHRPVLTILAREVIGIAAAAIRWRGGGSSGSSSTKPWCGAHALQRTPRRWCAPTPTPACDEEVEEVSV